MFHIVDIGLQKGREGQLYGLQVAEERPTESNQISVQNRQQTISEGRAD